MRFDRIELEHFKCYDDVSVRLDPGVTVIHGPNGSGKSSLLEACFFALYGTSAFDRTLEEFVTIGAEEASVDLRFVHAGGQYRLHRRVRVSGDRASTPDCVLETPDGTVEGVRDVEDTITDLLRMDAEAFVNCAYVRQGEINKLINASPSARQDMIDDLLQLGTLEEYRSRAADARLGVEDVLTGREELLADRDDRIAELEDEQLHERLNDHETDLAAVEADIDRFEENKTEAEETLEAAESVIEEHAEKREELEAVEERIADLREAIEETEDERTECREAIASCRERIEDLDGVIDDLREAADLPADADESAVTARLEELEAEADAVGEEIQAVSVEIQEHTGDAERHEERAADLTERAADKRDRADELADEVADAEETLEERRERLEDLEDELAEKRAEREAATFEEPDAEAHLAAVEDDLAATREEVTTLRENLATARSRVEEAEELLAAGKCPECGQPVEGSPHVESLASYREAVEEREAELAAAEDDLETLEERRERAEELVDLAATIDRLASEHESVSQLLEEREAAVADKREEIETLRTAADDLEAEATAATEAMETAQAAAEDARDRLGELNEQQGDLRERIDRLSRLADRLADRAEATAELERLQERRADLTDRNEERRELLADARERVAGLEEAVDADRLAEAKADRERASEYLTEVEEKLDELGDRRDALLGKIESTKGEITRLEELRAERDDIAERVEALRTLHGETADLETLYGDLRGELRQQNVARLERLLNETFDLVYQNDSYARIELSPAYELTVYQKDGEALDPEQLSGGERALFNLSLRSAIYRLLAEGIEGAAPMPPLILDEPTVFLDTGHVSRLVDLVESMRDLGVEQIVLVSHDEELVGAADDLLTVRKDPTTNRSTVSRRTAALAD